ncbi:MAG TPA: UvrD-helicase domain-containing protein [Streptosporangiaceae bacterium]
MLYHRLDGNRDRAAQRLASVLRENGGTHQARSERETLAVMYSRQLAQFDAAENGLCFGRLDFEQDDPRYIGRIGLREDSGDYEPLLLDWRAPAARPFYLATAASRDGVRRRRHIKTRQRTVTGLDDEVLDITVADPHDHQGLTSEAALLAALTAARTGQMSDIVETIQAEQDQVIRSGLAGVLVVQGGPGTGKTAVALHRAAYLLYTHREQLSKRGVLIVGPNPVFLRYIADVLPSLGETGVLMSTIADLYPGITADRAEPAATAAIKGELAMAQVLATAVRDRQWLPDAALKITVDRQVLRLDRRTCQRARTRARQSRRPHNQARRVFVAEVIEALARQVEGGLEAIAPGAGNLLGELDTAAIRQELRASPEVRAALDRLWPVLTPQQLLAGLFGSPDRLAAAASGLSQAQRAALLREPAAGWTPADIPLLDEAAELLGEDDTAARALARRRRRERAAYAQGVLDIMARDDLDDADPEILLGADMLDADRLAQRHAEEDYLTAAERAAADRTWAFGHIIVDEAQELSQMAWRMLMRRCPARSMTLVGDVAQTGDVGGASSWQAALGPHLADRWRLAQLTINYRAPAEVMTVAADVLAAIDPGLTPPRSVRETGVTPWALQLPAAELPRRLAGIVSAEAGQLGGGRLAVIAPAGRVAGLAGEILAAGQAVTVGADPELASPVAVLSVAQAKGLEFDSVIVVEPGQIIAGSPRGLGDLYVALTRPTQRLGVISSEELAAVLRGLGQAAGPAGPASTAERASTVPQAAASG